MIIERLERRQMEVRGIGVEVVRKRIKHLYLGVYPPHGRVRVSAPLHLTEDAVRLAVVSRLDWIRRRRAILEEQARQSQRELVSGESHYVQGRRYLLDVVRCAAPPGVRLVGNRTLELRVRPEADREQRDAVLQRWYRRQLQGQLESLVARWAPRVGETPAEVRIKRMKTRWGSCSIAARRIWLNLELAKKPALCLEYVLVHELVHLIERRHNQRFRELMDGLMPQWRLHRDALNRAPLAHADWRY